MALCPLESRPPAEILLISKVGYDILDRRIRGGVRCANVSGNFVTSNHSMIIHWLLSEFEC